MLRSRSLRSSFPTTQPESVQPPDCSSFAAFLPQLRPQSSRSSVRHLEPPFGSPSVPRAAYLLARTPTGLAGIVCPRSPTNVSCRPQVASSPAASGRREVGAPAQLVDALLGNAEEVGDLHEAKQPPPCHGQDLSRRRGAPEGERRQARCPDAASELPSRCQRVKESAP